MTEATLERRLRVAAVLVMLGLLVEGGSLGWHHPTAFIVFFVLGGALMAAGMLWYLYAIVSQGG
jgi:hypothetical protein